MFVPQPSFPWLRPDNFDREKARWLVVSRGVLFFDLLTSGDRVMASEVRDALGDPTIICGLFSAPSGEGHPYTLGMRAKELEAEADAEIDNATTDFNLCCSAQQVKMSLKSN